MVLMTLATTLDIDSVSTKRTVLATVLKDVMIDGNMMPTPKDHVKVFTVSAYGTTADPISASIPSNMKMFGLLRGGLPEISGRSSNS